MAAVASKKGGFLDFFKNLFKRKERVSADAGERNNWKAWLYLAPVIILLAVFTFYPLINTIVIAFLKDYDYTTQVSAGFTFDNFLTVLTLAGKDEAQNLVYKWNTFYSAEAGGYVYQNGAELMKVYFQTDVLKYALPNTMVITFVTVPLSIIIALLISVCLHSIKAFQKIFQTIFFVPYVTNAVAVGMVFAVLFDSKGILNFLFGLGTEFYWIDHAASWGHGMIALCIYIVWHALPYKILIFLSALQNIDKQYYDAAKIDCAGKFKTFMNVTVPMLSPQILYIMITSFIGSFKEYTSVVGLFGSPSTDGGSTKNMYTIVYYVYDCLSGTTTVSRGAAAAVMLFIIIMIFTAIQFQVSKRRVHY
ncbi:MAG: sugar ABC transporter permease [Bacilli bacterium]|nr:sugar ABC transporter permease [Bacilli bacterium]